jgi:hypothetical protein
MSQLTNNPISNPQTKSNWFTVHHVLVINIFVTLGMITQYILNNPTLFPHAWLPYEIPALGIYNIISSEIKGN